MELRCPTCGAPVAKASRAVPFCGERCRLVDLGGWLDERFRIAGSAEEDAAGASEAGDDEDSPAERPRIG